jgi:hypothetical protein
LSQKKGALAGWLAGWLAGVTGAISLAVVAPLLACQYRVSLSAGTMDDRSLNSQFSLCKCYSNQNNLLKNKLPAASQGA